MPRSALSQARGASSTRRMPRWMGGSTVFNGSTSKISIGAVTPIYAGTGTYTFCCWIKPNQATGERIILSGNSGRSMFGIEPGKFVNWVDTDNTKGNIDLSFSYGEWVFLSWSTNMATGATTLYKNGVLVGSNTQATYVAQDQYLARIGCYGGDNRFFVGNICMVETFLGGFTALQHAEMYYTGRVNGAVKMASYPLSDLPSTYIDTIGGNNGTGTDTAFSPDVPVQSRKAIVPYVGSYCANGSSTSIIVTENTTIKLDGAYFTWDTVTSFDTPTARLDSLAGKYDPSTDDGWLIEKLSNGKLFMLIKTTSGSNNLTSSKPITDTNFHRITVTYNGSMVLFYRDGVLTDTFTCTGTIIDGAGKNLRIAVRPSGAVTLGKFASARLYSCALTASEVANLYLTNTTPYDSDHTKLVLNLEAKTGRMSGSTWVDVSGNGNNGTVSGATLSTDAPTKDREKIDGNLFGSILLPAPYQVAPINTTSKWIDGTASGSTTITPFKLRTDNSGTHECSYEDKDGIPSIRISTKAVSSYVQLRLNAVGYTTYANEGVALKPGTQYRLSFRMKTNYVSGDATNGTVVAFLEADGAGALIIESLSTAIKTTTDWTTYTVTFTTNAATARGHLEFRLYGHQGTGTLIMDAWFDRASVRLDEA